MTARRLPIPLEPGAREAPLDYLSRLAFRNGRDGVRAICTDFGIRHAAVAGGEPGALAEVEVLGSVGAGTLATNAFTPSGERMRVLHKGEVLHRSMLSRYRIRICPACMADDVSAGQGRVEARLWRRNEWLLRDVRACRTHEMELVDIGDQPDPKVPDFSRGMSKVIGDLDTLRTSATHRRTSGHEDYIVSRLGDRPRAGPGSAEILDPLPLYACIRLSEVLGAVALDGPDAEMAGISEATLHARQAAGFDIAAAGVGSVHALLDRLREAHGRRSGHSGPQAFFGRLYLWLAHRSRDPAFEPIREMLREHCLRTVALGPGDAVAPFGEKVDARRIHSVRSAAVEYGLNPVSLRKVLTATGAVATDRPDLTDDMLTFDADEHAELLSDLSSSLELKDAAAHLGMPVSQAELLVREGIILPWLGNRQGMWKRRFRKADLDGFVGTLVRNVDPLLGADPGLCPVPAAARAACRRLADVVQMLVEGRLKRVGLKDDTTSYADILVDPDEIRSHSDAPASDTRTMSEASAETGLPPHVLRNLVRLGVLPDLLPDPSSGGSSAARIAAEDLRLFRERYVSLKELADDRGVTPRLLWNRLCETGIRPATDHRAAGAVIYRRQSVPDISRLDLVPWPAGRRR